jgi:hypothetical protein
MNYLIYEMNQVVPRILLGCLLGLGAAFYGFLFWLAGR